VKLTQVAQLVFVVIAAVAVYSFVSMARDAEHRRACTPLCAMTPTYAAENRLAPDFDLPTLDGKQVRLSDYRGKVVILNFWTKSCQPCLEEMPSLAELTELLKGHKDVAVLTVSTGADAKDVRNTVQSVLGKPPPFVVMVDPDASVVEGKFGTRLYPETWFIDPRGVIRARFDGARDWNKAIAIDFVKSLEDADACGIRFFRGEPSGNLASLCQDVGSSS
jgi:peroxiredoxin